MNYKLAKQLKDAGFPQNTIWVWTKDGSMNVEPKRYCMNIEEEREEVFNLQNSFIVADPTLSELIDACENELYFRLDSYMDEWRARISGNKNEKDIHIECLGKTTKEAVAKLWLRLNK